MNKFFKDTDMCWILGDDMLNAYVRILYQDFFKTGYAKLFPSQQSHLSNG